MVNNIIKDDKGEIFRQAEALRTVYFEGFLDLSKFAYVSEATINK